MSFIINGGGWLSLVFILFITTFGFNCFIFLVSSFSVIILGSIIAIHSSYQETKHKNPDKYRQLFDTNFKYSFLSRSSSINAGNGITFSSPIKRKKQDLTQVYCFTGEPEIDEQIREVLNFAFRDHVYSWYGYVSPNQEFTDHLKLNVQMVIRAITIRMRSIDRVNYITTKLVDDFASHLRLFRLSQENLLKLEDSNSNLLSVFFDLEFQMEKNICRDIVCEDDESFLDYLIHICDILQYLLLPPEFFNNRPLRYLVRSLLVNTILYPIIELLSDPDFVNQTIIWICKSTKAIQTLSSEIFLMVIRCTDCADELIAVKEIVNHEIAVMRSRDTGGDDDFEIKQQLSSLLYVQGVITNRLKCLSEGVALDTDSTGLPSSIDLKKFSKSDMKLFQLPFDVLLKNNIAISYFIEYMSSIAGQGYIYFYLNVEAFKISAEQQLLEAALIKSGQSGSSNLPDLECLKEAAINIYETYLAPEKQSTSKLSIDENITRKIKCRIFTEDLNENWFDDAQEIVFKVMRDDEKFFPGFKKSIHYIKLLAELDLLKDIGNNNNENGQRTDEDIDCEPNECDFYEQSCTTTKVMEENNSIDELEDDKTMGIQQTMKSEIIADIYNTGVVREFGNSYAVYAITVNKREIGKAEDKWCVLRRYSDFHSFHQNTMEKFSHIFNLSLPGKRTFNNMSHEFLEQRRHLLNSYLQQILRVTNFQFENNISGLQEHVLRFLEPGNYEKDKGKQTIAETMNSVFNPFKSSVKSVGNIMKSGSDNFMQGIQKLGKLGSMGSSGSATSPPNTPKPKKAQSHLNFPAPSQTLNVNSNRPSPSGSCSSLASAASGNIYTAESFKVASSLDIETEENIPLRIMLLLMDEVFDLKHKNLWLRRRIVAVVRQIIQSTFGDKINKKIVDFVEELTSSQSIAEYIKSFKNTQWPNGYKALPRNPRSHSKKMRTRVSAKLLMISSLSDDLKHIIGTETTRKGLLYVFNMFQHEQLNKRLVLVLFEGLLLQLFPDNHFPQILKRLHSISYRMAQNKDESKKERSCWPPYFSKFNDEGGTTTKSSKSASPSTSVKSSPVTKRPILR